MSQKLKWGTYTMLINKLQKFFNSKIDYFSTNKIEKFIIEYLYKNNFGPESNGAYDIPLKSYKKIYNALIANSDIFDHAMNNLKFKNLISFSGNDNEYSDIKITVDGMTYYTQNHLFIKQLLLTSVISSLFSFLVGVITALIFNY